MRQSRWEQDGQSRSRMEVVANNVQLLGGGSGSGQNSQNRNEKTAGNFTQNSGQNRKSDSGFSSNGPEQFDDDIPF